MAELQRSITVAKRTGPQLPGWLNTFQIHQYLEMATFGQQLMRNVCSMKLALGEWLSVEDV
jgi:hypothetical protein